MSTANVVPETWQLRGDDAKETLAATDRSALVRDAIVRLRFADGFSHARSMGFLTVLLFVQGVIGAIGIASALGGLAGGVLLLNTGEETFRVLVPYLLLLAAGLLAIEGPVHRWHERRSAAPNRHCLRRG